MMISVIEARVKKENWPILQQAYQRSAGQTPPGLEQSFLVHGVEDEEVWQIVSVWSGMPSLQQIQQSKEKGITPRGVLIFREAQAEAVHAIFEVVEHLVAAGKTPS